MKISENGQEDVDFILIVGMHRSGTSMLAHIITKLGYNIGKCPLRPARCNPEGFFENEAIKRFDDKLLKCMGTSWSDTSSIDPDFLERMASGDFLFEFFTMLEYQFKGQTKRLVKDPRLCRLIPFWTAAFGSLGIKNSRCLLPIRHPFNVARSLQKRDKFVISHGLLLWIQNVLAAERGTRALRRMVTIYDDVLSGKSSSSLAGFLGMDQSFLDSSIKQVADPQLRHENDCLSGGGIEPDIEDLAMRVWDILHSSACKRIVNQTSLDKLWNDYLDVSREFQHYGRSWTPKGA